MKISDLNNFIDLSNNDTISNTILTTNKDQNFYDRNLIPTVENALLLKNKYEVIEVKEDYQGTLEQLIKMKGKKIPETVPFILVYLVGGGSGGGWVEYPDLPMFDTFKEENGGHGIVDEVNYGYNQGSGLYGSGYKSIPTKKWINNINLKTNINISIGESGKSLKNNTFYSKSATDYLAFEEAMEANFYKPNSGKPTIFKVNGSEFLRSFGGGCEYEGDNITEEQKNNILKEQMINILDCKKYISGIYQLNHDLDIQINPFIESISKTNKLFNYFILHNYLPVSIQLPFTSRIFQWHGSSLTNRPWGSTMFYTDINYVNIDIYNNYLNNIKDNFSKRPGINEEDYYKDIINDYGLHYYINRNVGHANSVFFDGLDVTYFGSPGLSGSIATYRDINRVTNQDSHPYNFQRGYCGKGGDGVCYIYYPSEV